MADLLYETTKAQVIKHLLASARDYPKVTFKNPNEFPFSLNLRPNASSD